MNTKPALLLIPLLAFFLPAAAQLNSSALRAKFGAPLNRETFHLTGFDLIADYGPVNQVCRLQMPARLVSAPPQRMQQFLEELVPDSIRGKKLGEFASSAGIISLESTQYEHVIISRSHDASRPFDGTITVTFTGNGCQPAE